MGCVKFKAGLVSRGFTRFREFDYIGTFASVLNHSALTISLAFLETGVLEFCKMDEKTALLSEALDEKNLRAQPEGYIDAKKPTYGRKLETSFHGFSKAPRK